MRANASPDIPPASSGGPPGWTGSGPTSAFSQIERSSASCSLAPAPAGLVDPSAW